MYYPEIYATCPQSVHHQPEEYARAVSEVAQWSEEAGCRGILVYSDNRLTDPWITSHQVLEATKELVPLIAVQPVYMHPYMIAKKIATFAMMYQRRIALNMIAGGFSNDLKSLNDHTPHDERYDRLYEYTNIIQSLLTDAQPVSQEGRYYSVSNLKIAPEVPDTFIPEVFVSGSSEAGRETAKKLSATAVEYPGPLGADAHEVTSSSVPEKRGIRLGIIARSTNEEAWEVARKRFPKTRAGELLHSLAMRNSDSKWHQQLSNLEEYPSESRIYWLGPFKSYNTFCPYLVGSFEEVAEYLHGYLQKGYNRIILDIPPDRDDINYTMDTFRLASSREVL